MSSVTKLIVKSKKLSVGEIIKNLVGNLENIPTETDISLAEEMEEHAEEHGGEYDPENNSVIFDGKESSVTVFASTDKDASIYYQAVHEQFKPRIFTSGKVSFSFKDALANLTLES